MRSPEYGGPSVAAGDLLFWPAEFCQIFGNTQVWHSPQKGLAYCFEGRRVL